MTKIIEQLEYEDLMRAFKNRLDYLRVRVRRVLEDNDVNELDIENVVDHLVENQWDLFLKEIKKNASIVETI